MNDYQIFNNIIFQQNQYNIGRANIIIIGAGGAGNNTIDRLMENNIYGAHCVAVNTDQQHLNSIKAHYKLLIGKNVTRGLGTGGHPEIGRVAAEESKNELNMILKGADLVFITCGLGGGTGTGSSPIIAELANKTGAIVVGVVTMPFKTEKGRIEKAKQGLIQLKKFLNTLVIIDNNKLLEIAPNLPIVDAFSIADEVLATMVKGITETISQRSLINLDYADVRSILTAGGMSIVGIGESSLNSDHPAEEAVEDALHSPLLQLDISGATGALIHVSGGNNLTLRDVHRVSEIITSNMAEKSLVIIGARIDPSLEGYLRVMLLLTGIKSPQIVGSIDSYSDKDFRKNPFLRTFIS